MGEGADAAPPGLLPSDDQELEATLQVATPHNGGVALSSDPAASDASDAAPRSPDAAAAIESLHAADQAEVPESQPSTPRALPGHCWRKGTPDSQPLPDACSDPPSPPAALPRVASAEWRLERVPQWAAPRAFRMRRARLLHTETAVRRSVEAAERAELRAAGGAGVSAIAWSVERTARALCVKAEGEQRRELYFAEIRSEGHIRRHRKRHRPARMLAELGETEPLERQGIAGDEADERLRIQDERPPVIAAQQWKDMLARGVRAPVPPHAEWGDASCPFLYRQHCPMAAKKYVSRQFLQQEHHARCGTRAAPRMSVVRQYANQSRGHTRLERMLERFRRSTPLSVERTGFAFPAAPGGEPQEFDVTPEACGLYGVAHRERIRCGRRCANEGLSGAAVTVVGVLEGVLWVRADGRPAAEQLHLTQGAAEAALAAGAPRAAGWEQLELVYDCRRLCEMGRLRNHYPTASAPCYWLEPQRPGGAPRRWCLSSEIPPPTTQTHDYHRTRRAEDPLVVLEQGIAELHDTFWAE
eukprot:TRINITY_DN9986_c0_g1_i1.p1 TRINITY_DN9986_c0_g1~~TRINITY_DN9986_c0_g1_i1.p1  ORF type:complete len:551 (+),score=149.01 TRINITY_DN9986_c0_g1_i1:67-1653(+)